MVRIGKTCPTSVVAALTALLALASCESPFDVESIGGEVDLQAGRPARSVKGSGGFTVGAGLLRTFSFNAKTRLDGVTDGKFQGYNRQSGGRIQGSVTCIGLDGTGAMWVAGSIEKANFDVVGVPTGWYAVDGEFNGSFQDQLSFAIAVDSAEEFCAEMPDPPSISLVVRDLEFGNIKIKP